MAQKLCEIIRFREDRLFNGAVSINWFSTDGEKTDAAANAFVFHGPQYHGVQQEDVGVSHEHNLVDSANFTRSVIRRCYGVEDQPFTLAIAGYGSGKSHLGLTLAKMLSDPQSRTAQNILDAITGADHSIGDDVKTILNQSTQPCLVVALNGMQSFDFTAEFTKQIVSRLKHDGLDSKPLDELRPRFGQAVRLIRMASETVAAELVSALNAPTVEQIIAELEQQDEHIYSKVHDFFAAQGMTIRALAGESVKDVIDIAAKEYCGEGKPYRSLLVLFDEFGKYTEFATMRSQIAGSGVLQDLFEGIQANAGATCFVGFIQFDLNSYVDRVAPEYKNEILRYVTRYQLSDKLFLSTNLETLIANLLEKEQAAFLDKQFDGEKMRTISADAMNNIGKWFSEARRYRLWSNHEQFHNVVAKGCWPLSPYTTWLLFSLTSAGKYLQERSALALLGEAFRRFGGKTIEDDENWTISPANLWSDMLLQDFIGAEEMGQQGAIAHAYATVAAKHGSKFPHELILLLRSVVLASKLGLKVADKEKAVRALACLAGVDFDTANHGVNLLQEEYNVLEWDEAFKSFDILGDAVPRTQFLAYLRQKARSYNEESRAQLFAGKALEWCELLVDVKCDFAEVNNITTREWRYQAVAANLISLPSQVKLASQQWKDAIQVDIPRGTVIYLYVDANRDPDAVSSTARQLLQETAKEMHQATLPILLVLLYDEEGALGQYLAEYSALHEMSDAERAQFGNLVGAQQEKLRKVIYNHVEQMIKERRYVSGMKEKPAARRLAQVGSELFAEIYNSTIPFPFDGFSTARGNAAETCHELTRELLTGKLDFEGVLAKPQKSRHRATRVLKEKWGVFNPKLGTVTRRPTLPVIRDLTEKWDDALVAEQRLSVGDIIKEICLPPYGANIASAGLLLAVYIAPRTNELAILKGEEQIAISQWIQDGVFKGKFVSLSLISDVDLMQLGDGPSEWETMLDEWEQCPDHVGKVSMVERVMELKNRVPVPPMLAYRFQALLEQARVSKEEIEKMEQKQNEVLSKLQNGYQRQDVATLVWGAIDLKKLHNRMVTEHPAWPESQIATIQSGLEQSILAIQDLFPKWLSQQTPSADTPVAVGDFKHKMLRIVAPSLKKLGLETESDELEKHTLKVIRNAENIAEAKQLLRDVKNWMTSNAEVVRIGRIMELRATKKVGQNYLQELKKIAGAVPLADISETTNALHRFIEKLQMAENTISKKAGKVWGSEINSVNDIEILINEINQLISLYEGFPDDLEDFIIMNKVLRSIKDSFDILSDRNLTWDMLSTSFQMIINDLDNLITEDDEIPWEPKVVIKSLYDGIKKDRKIKSTEWTQMIIKRADNINNMTVAEANQFLSEAENVPPYVTQADKEKLQEIVQKVTSHLEKLIIEWLVEKFKELSEESRQEFLDMVREIA